MIGPIKTVGVYVEDPKGNPCRLLVGRGHRRNNESIQIQR
jgi:hypothetical protein